MLSPGSPARPTRAATHRTESWRPCLYPCRRSWSTRTVCGGRTSSVRPYTVYTSGRSGHSCGNGISVPLRMESANYCHFTPEPKTTQHLPVAALQTAGTWQRSCGPLTNRPKGRLKVWAGPRSVYSSDKSLYYNLLMTDVSSRLAQFLQPHVSSSFCTLIEFNLIVQKHDTSSH